MSWRGPWRRWRRLGVGDLLTTLCRYATMMQVRPISKLTVKVLKEFFENPRHDQYGFGLMGATGVKSGSLCPILDQLTARGWIESFEEDIDEHVEGRPKRRLYRLTALGQREGRKAIADFYEDLGP